MGRSLIQTVNQSTQEVAENGIISLGSVVRRYGCNQWLSGDALEINGDGYYKIDGAVVIAPTAAGDVTVALFDNGIQIPGAIATGSITTVGNSTTLPFVATIRKSCCDGVSAITCRLVDGAGTVSNIAVRSERS